jgi:hypothetical protein
MPRTDPLFRLGRSHPPISLLEQMPMLRVRQTYWAMKAMIPVEGDITKEKEIGGYTLALTLNGLAQDLLYLGRR